MTPLCEKSYEYTTIFMRLHWISRLNELKILDFSCILYRFEVRETEGKIYFFFGRKSNGGRWLSFNRLAPISPTASTEIEPVSHPNF